jgi:enoyl-CoA hydratase/carnithine racemase
MTAGTIGLDVDGMVATLTLDNPAKRNAMSAAMWIELRARIAELSRLDEVRAVIVRGGGTAAFCAGADIADFDTARTGPDNASAYDDLVEETCVALEAIRCPSIALIHGACMGAGVSVAASCDLRILSHDAVFAVPAARLGLGYDPRGIARFLRVYGAPATTYLALTGDRLEADRAYALGVGVGMGDAEAADAMAARLANGIAAKAPLTLAAAKAAIRAHSIGGIGLGSEALRLYAAADASDDYQEGRRAFKEKRAPRFEGK